MPEQAESGVYNINCYGVPSARKNLLGKTMRNIAVVVSCVAVFVFGLWLSWLLGDCSQSSRSGALIVAIVVLVEGWLLLVTKSSDDMPFWKKPESHQAARVAVALIAFGTLVQGYGDLLAKGLLLCH